MRHPLDARRPVRDVRTDEASATKRRGGYRPTPSDLAARRRKIDEIAERIARKEPAHEPR